MDILELTEQLIRIPSVSYKEIECAAFICRVLASQGFSPVVDEFNPNEFLGGDSDHVETANVYVDIGTGREALVLYAHIDVVPVVSGDQFRPRIEDNHLVGRGSVDMKSAVAALMVAATAKRRQIVESGGRVILLFVADEESSGTGAQRSLRWLERLDIDRFSCVLLEPTDDFSLIEVGAKGYVFIRLEGQLASVVPCLRRLLVERAELVGKYRSKDRRYGDTHLSVTAIDCKGSESWAPTRIVKGTSAHASRPDLGSNALEEYLGSSTSPVSRIRTVGNSHNTLPALLEVMEAEEFADEECEAFLDLRTTPEADEGDRFLEDVSSRLNRVHAGLRWSVFKRGRAFGVPADSSLVSLCKASVQGEVREIIAQGGSDAGYYARVAQEVIGGFGPGERRFQHSAEERIRLSSLREAPAVVERLVAGFLPQL